MPSQRFKGVHDFWRGTYFRGGMEKFSAENITIVPENETAELGASDADI